MKPSTNKRNYAKIYIGLILTVSLVIIFLPILWGDRTDPFWKFIYNFQPLIAGCMAVLAAVITVNQMRKSEEAQDVRHQQTLNASTFYPSKDIKFVAEQLSDELKKSARSIKNLQENLQKSTDSWCSTNTIYYFEVARGIDSFNTIFRELITSKYRPLIDSEIIVKADTLLYFGMFIVELIPSDAYANTKGMFSKHDRPDWLTDHYIEAMPEILDSINNFLELVQAWEKRTLDEIQSLNYIFKPN